MKKMQSILSKYPSSEIFILTDEHVLGHLATLGLDTYPRLVLAAGENQKSLAGAERVWQFLFEHEASRRALLVNVGGGVITDLGGFAAATYKRGIDFLNVPTTLLSMVDAASGGKTGINYGGIKNSIGVFRQPVYTHIDTRLLTKLPAEEILSGYAEVVKHWLLEPSGAAIFVDPFSLTNEDIERSLAVKNHYAALDPTEQGIRKALNLGHTIGHALEALSEGKLRHGYAVLYGLAAELYLSHVRLGLDSKLVSQVAHLITEYYGRPQLSCKRYDELLALMRQDKKGALNFTLLKQVGDPVINQIASRDEIFESLDYLFSI